MQTHTHTHARTHKHRHTHATIIKLSLKPKKCALFQRSVKFLGHVVSQEGVSCDPDKVSCVKEWKVLECVTGVHSFLGFASYYRGFIPEFAAIATPLTR